MQFIWRRYSRSGYAPPLFYIAVAIGFCALGAWAIVESEWVVAAIAIVMAPATIAGSRVMRRLNEAETASRAELAAAERERRDG